MFVIPTSFTPFSSFSRPSRLGVLLSLIIVFYGATVRLMAQRTPTETQNTVKSPQSLGGIHGIVQDGSSGIGIPDATVIAFSIGSKPDKMECITSASGSFAFEKVADASYQLSVKASGYGSGSSGISVTTSSNKVITIVRGTLVRDVTLSLLKAGSISGRIVDFDKRPISGMRVVAMSLRSFGDEARLVEISNPTQTNVAGEYSLIDIPQGAYFIGVTSTSSSTTSANESSSPSHQAYVPTYYPSAETADDALSVAIRPGESLAGIDIEVRPHIGYRVRGRVIGQPVGPWRAMIALVPVSAGGRTRTSSLDKKTVRADESGQYSFDSLPAGSYRISASVSAGAEAMFGFESGRVSETHMEFPGIMLVKPFAISGQLRFSPAELTEKALEKPLMVHVVPIDPLAPFPESIQAKVDRSGVFTLPAVRVGRHHVYVSGQDSNWYLGAVRYGYVDSPLGNFDAVPGGAELDLAMKANGAAVVGTVTDRKGRPVPHAYVYLENESSNWRLGKSCDQTGVFSFQGLPPGKYALYAFDGIERNQLELRHVLDRYRAGALSLNLSDAEKRVAMPMAITQGQ